MDVEDLGVFHVEYLLGYGHLQFVDLPQVGESPSFFAVEDLVSVQIDLQTPFVRGSHLRLGILSGIP